MDGKILAIAAQAVLSKLIDEKENDGKAKKSS
jgi:hypothetical protein